ncbi:hypothetical protein AGMMS49938_17060 [Fibrobacterales bacterium]|nr:hypothetical protein AGMMS49938_17060 [Fibrobacterales bacterium]
MPNAPNKIVKFPVMKNFLLCLVFFATAIAAQTRDTLTFAAVGDIMIGLNYPSDKAILPKQDGVLTFESVKGVLQNADITIGNLEGVLLDSGGTAKRCSNPNVCFVFRMPTRYGQLLKDAGFDLLSIANNHSGDMGDVGRKSSQATLKNLGIGYAGFEGTSETYILEKDGVKYGFAAFAPNTGTVRVTDTAGARKLISDLRKKTDIVIVSMHIGAEGNGKNHITRQTEEFVGENRGNPYLFARIAIDAGADMVIGHGPHVPRAVDLYKGKFIAYSLGNFATNTSVNINGVSGYAPILKIKTDRNGNFLGGEIISAIQRGENGDRRPILDETNACAKEIKKLTESDIPETGIVVEESGKIRLK